jgi:hypothetical protein
MNMTSQDKTGEARETGWSGQQQTSGVLKRGRPFIGFVMGEEEMRAKGGNRRKRTGRVQEWTVTTRRSSPSAGGGW